MSSHTGKMPLRSQTPPLRPHSRLGQTNFPAPCQGQSPQTTPQGVLAWAKPRKGYPLQASLVVVLCTYLEGQGDPGALGPLPAPCPRQKPAVSLHLWEEQVAVTSGWSRHGWEAETEVPPKPGQAPQALLGLRAALAKRCYCSHCSEEHTEARSKGFI